MYALNYSFIILWGVQGNKCSNMTDVRNNHNYTVFLRDSVPYGKASHFTREHCNNCIIFRYCVVWQCMIQHVMDGEHLFVADTFHKTTIKSFLCLVLQQLYHSFCSNSFTWRVTTINLTNRGHVLNRPVIAIYLGLVKWKLLLSYYSHSNVTFSAEKKTMTHSRTQSSTHRLNNRHTAR